MDEIREILIKNVMSCLKKDIMPVKLDVKLSSSVYEVLENKANSRGISINDVIAEVLEENVGQFLQGKQGNL